MLIKGFALLLALLFLLLLFRSPVLPFILNRLNKNLTVSFLGGFLFPFYIKVRDFKLIIDYGGKEDHILITADHAAFYIDPFRLFSGQIAIHTLKVKNINFVYTNRTPAREGYYPIKPWLMLRDFEIEKGCFILHDETIQPVRIIKADIETFRGNHFDISHPSLILFAGSGKAHVMGKDINAVQNQEETILTIEGISLRDFDIPVIDAPVKVFIHKKHEKYSGHFMIAGEEVRFLFYLPDEEMRISFEKSLYRLGKEIFEHTKAYGIAGSIISGGRSLFDFFRNS